MNNDEWEGMSKYLQEENFWADIILSEGKIRKLDETPMVGFPEISMHGMFPWGGFGASVLPKRVKNQWNSVKEVSDGGFPYSEGIYEDVTKIVYSQYFWNNRPYEETLREYIAYELGEKHIDKLLQVMETLEQNHHFRWWPGQMDGTDFPQHWIPNKEAKPQEDPGAEEAWAIVQQVEEDLPEWASSSWRWRILFLRAFLDAELKANSGIPNTKCHKAFEELIVIYHAQNADPVVRPPLPRD
jgi:hypothetical protein